MHLNNVIETYPLSPMQQGLLFESLYAPGSGVNIVQLFIDLPEALDVGGFQQAWQQAVDRHPVLRTAFRWQGLEAPQQDVYRTVDVPVKLVDWRTLSTQEQQQQRERLLKTDRRRGFALDKPGLMRLQLFHRGAADYQCLWTFHHLILDGRSLTIVMEEVFAAYEALRRGQAPQQLPQPRPYRDYIDWWQAQDVSRWQEFWQQTLGNAALPTPLVVDRPDHHHDETQGYETQDIHLSKATTTALTKLTEQHQLTLNTLLQGAWALLLSRYSGQTDVVFGITRACRRSTIAGAESMVGLFTNTLPLRVQITADMPVQTWLKAIREQNIDLRPYEQTPLANIKKWARSASDMPLFESNVVFENYFYDAALHPQGGENTNRSLQLLNQPTFPLILYGYAGPRLRLRLVYDQVRFEAASIERMFGHLQTLLEDFVASPKALLGDISLLSEAEVREQLFTWNATAAAYPEQATLHQLFAAQAGRTPDKIAVTFEGSQLTYRQLDQQANQVAHLLKQQGVGPDVLVAVCLTRSPDMVVALLAVLKAGGAYLPIDPAIPEARMQFMLADSGVKHLVTRRSLLNAALAKVSSRLLLDADSHNITRQPLTAPPHDAAPHHLAYCLYTSGSTGQPKGVLIEHRNVVRLLINNRLPFNFSDDDVWTMFHTYSFDFSVWEMYGALLYGGRLVVVPEAVTRDPALFLELLIRERVTVLNQTPSFFYTLAETALRQAPSLPALRYLIFGGETLDPIQLKPWRQHYPQVTLVNMYGITETTVHVTFKEITEQEIQENQSNIGRPIPTTTTYVLDSNLKLLPVGVAGEICVGGAGVSRGYLNRPDLTRKKFTPDPYQPPGRLYRSGDLGRLLPGGELEYLGRLDDQVQIRGFRVELGEVRSQLLTHPSVTAAVVIPRTEEQRGTSLVAYVVTGTNLNVTELRQHLQHALPDYMIPSTFIRLERLPLTVNGKVDRQALPQPNQARPELAGEFISPRPGIEASLANIWSEVLGQAQIGRHDNFFELGGHSLLATQLVSRIRDAFQVELPLRCLFETPTIAGLATEIILSEMDQVDDELLTQLLNEIEEG